ncbi:MFS transporter [Polymorphospora sp. NPDC050346]|uniref:MFS transporter n=1 Tax=Polymorphospora sp. NPDC050346 TaxID=3155780 RepID=UPI0033C91733
MTIRPTGMAAFSTLWTGQVLSGMGTRMTQFALSIWVWQQTGSATALAVMTFLAYGATVAASPFAGALIDRWRRRVSLAASDAASLVVTVGVLLLFWSGSVEVWHLFLANAVTGAFLAFQGPAYTSTITALVPKQGFPRANAMMALSRSVPGVFAPVVAAALMALVDIETVLLIDVVSYGFALVAVMLVTLPAPAAAGDGKKRRSIWRDAGYGFGFIRRHPGLLALQGAGLSIGVLAAMGWIVLTPLIMISSGDDEVQVGIVNSVGAIGGILGGIVVTAIKPPARKIPVMFAAIIGFAVFGRILLGLGDSLVMWSIGWFCAWLCIPLIEAYSQSIWQERVSQEVQGRVFAARQAISQLALPVAMVITGPLVDDVFEPSMMPDGALAGIFGSLVGTGPGAGMSLIMLLSGVIGVLVGLSGFVFRRLRALDDIPSTSGDPGGESGGPTADPAGGPAEPARDPGKPAVGQAGRSG